MISTQKFPFNKEKLDGNYFADAAFNKAALFFAIWLFFGSAERLPNSMLVASFKNCTSNLEVVLFFLSFLFKRVTPMVLYFNVFNPFEVGSGFEPL